MKLSIIITNLIAGLLIIFVCAFYSSPKLLYAWIAISNFVALIEYILSNKENKKEDGIYSWLFSNRIKRDEREKEIFNKSTQLSLSIGFLVALLFYFELLEPSSYDSVKYSWLFWCFGIIFLSRGILMYVYTYFVKIEA